MNAIAQLINEKWYGHKAASQATQGSSENITLMMEGELDAAQAQASTMTEALNGTGAFEGNPIEFEFRSLATVQFNVIHCLVHESTKAATPADLKGKRVGVGPVAGAHDTAANLLFKSYGLTYDDIIPIYGSVSENMEALKVGQIDAQIYCTPPPSSSVNDLFSTGKISLLGMSKEMAEKIDSDNDHQGVYIIPAGTYTGQTEDVYSVGTPTLFFVPATMDEEWAYQFTKLIFENNEYLMGFHNNFSLTIPENVNAGRCIPMHAGAVRYLKEVGVTVQDPLEK
jgi:TRAP transporter TAXI family solute receptor